MARNVVNTERLVYTAETRGQTAKGSPSGLVFRTAIGCCLVLPQLNDQTLYVVDQRHEL